MPPSPQFSVSFSHRQPLYAYIGYNDAAIEIYATRARPHRMPLEIIRNFRESVIRFLFEHKEFMIFKFD